MNERDYAVDFIRLAAIIGVVIIHTSSAFTIPTESTTLSFFVIHAINQAARFAVPLFFGISGFLLASRYFDIKSPWKFYKKRGSKILIPYISWTLIYFLIVYPTPIENLFTTKFLDIFLTGKAAYQLYFIPVIIIFYALFPLIIYYRKYLLSKWSLVALLIIQTLILTNAFVGHINISMYSPLKDASYNLLPFIIGIYAGINKIDIYQWARKNLLILIGGFLLLWGFMIYDSILLFNYSLNSFYLRHQWRIEVMLYGIITAGLLYYIYKKYLTRFSKQILYLSQFSFGIFFVHVAIMQYIFRYLVDTENQNGIFWFSLVLTITIGLSIIFCIALSKVKIISKLLGLKG